jgi:hypothetical protein
MWPSDIEDDVAFVASHYKDKPKKLVSISALVVDKDHLEVDGILFERTRNENDILGTCPVHT